jgi:hypothetical protein
MQIHTKVYRGNHVISQSLLKPPEAARRDADGGMISLSDELPLRGLPPGAYTLEVTATDRSANAGATQRVAFWIQ